jgi:hypothetical protein
MYKIFCCLKKWYISSVAYALRLIPTVEEIFRAKKHNTAGYGQHALMMLW